MITEDRETFSDTVEEEHSVEACTKCTACNTVCPVARSTEIFRGPKSLGPESERYRDPHEATVTAGLDLCSGCKLCEVTCPSQVSIQEYIRRAQNKGAREKGRTLRDWLLGHTRLLSRFGSLTAPLANFNPAYLVTIDIQRLDSIRGQAAVLEAVWTVRKTAGGETRSSRTVARETVRGDGFEALAAAHSRALAKLSGDIAAAIRAEAEQKP